MCMAPPRRQYGRLPRARSSEVVGQGQVLGVAANLGRDRATHRRQQFGVGASCEADIRAANCLCEVAYLVGMSAYRVLRHWLTIWPSCGFGIEVQEKRVLTRLDSLRP